MVCFAFACLLTCKKGHFACFSWEGLSEQSGPQVKLHLLENKLFSLPVADRENQSILCT